MYLIGSWGYITATIIANTIGGSIFFFVDRFIFTTDILSSQWEIKDNVKCVDCGKLARGYRLVKTSNYDRTESTPEFRCEKCSKKKTKKLKEAGVKIEGL
jgi:DNA-directed RNA polymerase subunit RPC12/RpoP